MKEDILLEKYTRALFETAEANNALKAVEAGLKRIDQTFDNLPQLAGFLTSPQVDWKEKLTLADTLTKGLSHYLVNFVKLVMEKERHYILPHVGTQFRKMLELRRKREEVQVTTVVPLPDDIKKALKAKLLAGTDKEIILKEEIDPAILGGFKLKIGHTMIDGTIKRKLEELGRRLVKG
ncbi:ATP synthase F1 subunit delta [bacterium]|nr:ATP synthase F1 subunit delta [FCB group bacterium]MBL7191757.1 ATP synthase F1 subunit delta [bacterium]